jgi:deoxyhypusine monooxygenase
MAACTLANLHLNVVLDEKTNQFASSSSSSASSSTTTTTTTTTNYNMPTTDELRTCLLGTESIPPSSPAAKYTRAIYYLRSLGTEESVDILCSALRLKSHSPLIRHEIGYVLGQMQTGRACVALEEVLLDKRDDIMVRHECAEALGAIGEERSLPLLQRMSQGKQGDDIDGIDANPDDGMPEELRETCEIAFDFCKWKSEGENGQRPEVACACMLSPYNSYDPAPPSPETDQYTTAILGDRLLDASLPLFSRYQAMFALRNRGGEECVVQLGRALVKDNSSALLRHEVAYVLGQMAHSAAITPLAESLRRSQEHSMVRHESAEALGAIEGDECETERCKELLREFANPMHEKDDVVRESCEVALDTMDYWNSFVEA